MSKKMDGIAENRKIFEDYFDEDLKAIEEELKQSKKYSEIIDTEIDKLSAPALGSNKGSQHYLIEHINNAVALQTQRQGLRKDRFAIKKAIMDYAAKFSDGDSSGGDSIQDAINKILELDKKKSEEVKISYESNDDIEDIDSDIDDILDNLDKK